MVKDFIEIVESPQRGPWRLITIFITGVFVFSLVGYITSSASAFPGADILLATVAFTTIYAAVALFLLAIRNSIEAIQNRIQAEDRAATALIRLPASTFSYVVQHSVDGTEFIQGQYFDPEVRLLCDLGIAREAKVPDSFDHPVTGHIGNWYFEMETAVHRSLMPFINEFRRADPKLSKPQVIMDLEKKFGEQREQWIVGSRLRRPKIRIRNAVLAMSIAVLGWSISYPASLYWAHKTHRRIQTTQKDFQQHADDFDKLIAGRSESQKLNAEEVTQFQKTVGLAAAIGANVKPAVVDTIADAKAYINSTLYQTFFDRIVFLQRVIRTTRRLMIAMSLFVIVILGFGLLQVWTSTNQIRRERNKLSSPEFREHARLN